MQNGPAPGSRPFDRATLKVIIFFFSIILAGLIVRFFHGTALLLTLRTWIASMGFVGALCYVLFYAFGAAVALPGSLLSITAGVLYGSFWGAWVAIAGSTLGAALAFLFARYMARESIERRLSGNDRFNRLTALTRERGSLMVAAARLMPFFPFTLVNYGFGLTRVKFGIYIFWSALCMIPNTLFYVLTADAVTRTAAGARIPWSLYTVALLLLVMVIVIVGLIRRKIE